MKLIYLPVQLFLLLLPLFYQAGPADKIIQLIKQGNAPGLAALFAANTDMALPGIAGVYPKAQAGILLEKFFKENRPLAANVLHRITSNPAYSFAVLILNTDKGKYRVSFTLKEVAGTMEIIELRIESEKPN